MNIPERSEFGSSSMNEEEPILAIASSEEAGVSVMVCMGSELDSLTDLPSFRWIRACACRDDLYHDRQSADEKH